MERSSPPHKLLLPDDFFSDDKARAAYPTEDDLRATLLYKSFQAVFDRFDATKELFSHARKE